MNIVRAASRRVLWLDATAYTDCLLMRGAAPWLNAAGYVAWQRTAQALLNSDVIGVPVARLADAWATADDGLRHAMRARRRSTYPLQALLGHAELREHLSDLTRDLRATFRDRVLALTLPAPRRLLDAAHALAHGDENPPAIEDDDTEIAAMYVADFLRAFAGDGIDVVLLEESATGPTLLHDAAYEPLINLARHYRWDIGVRAYALESGSDELGFDFTVTAASPLRPTEGIEVDGRFWSGAVMPMVPSGSFLFAEIPADTAPEQVLERLAMLRAA